MNTQLSTIDASSASNKASSGQGLTLKEAAVAFALGYSAIREMSKLPGFPIFGGKVWAADFHLWRRQRLGLEKAAPHTSARRQTSTAGKRD